MHLTLSDVAGEPPWGDAWAAPARAHFSAALATRPGAGELAWFTEPASGAPFRLVRRLGWGDAA